MDSHKEYLKFRNNNGIILVRKNSLRRIANIDAIIFDCDGVLIDVKQSYYKATIETVKYIINNLTNSNIEDLISNEIIHLFKKSGGYNNEWDVSYAITLFIILNFPKDVLNEISSIVKSKLFRGASLCERLSIIKNELYKYQPIKISKSIKNELKEFAERMDYLGIASLDKILRNSFKINEDILKSIKKFLSYPGNVKESIITRIFEEIFCGPKFFNKVYNIKPCFYFGKGLINNEKLIVSNKLLNDILLKKKVKIGIVSGRPSIFAKYSLKRKIEKFDEKSLIFLDKIKANRKKIKISKPNPLMLFECAKRLEPFCLALYIGDSIEDAIMVKLANKKENKFLFAGVYKHTLIPKKTILEFLNLKADLILPSILELPLIINKNNGGNIVA
jgi:phosphoglycolate phosphatase-like HAD superfamily hydrolase